MSKGLEGVESPGAHVGIRKWHGLACFIPGFSLDRPTVPMLRVT